MTTEMMKEQEYHSENAQTSNDLKTSAKILVENVALSNMEAHNAAGIPVAQTWSAASGQQNFALMQNHDLNFSADLGNELDENMDPQHSPDGKRKRTAPRSYATSPSSPEKIKKISGSFTTTPNAQDILDKAARAIKIESKNIRSPVPGKSPAPFVVIGETLDKLYYKDKVLKNQKEFLDWTKQFLGYSKSTTYEYIISYRVYSDIVKTLAPNYTAPQYQSHCQLLSKIASEDLARVWMEVSDSCNQQVTTAVLEKYLSKNRLKPKKVAPPPKKRKTSQKKAGQKRRRRDDSDSDEEEPSSPFLESDDAMNVIPWSGPGRRGGDGESSPLSGTASQSVSVTDVAAASAMSFVMEDAQQQQQQQLQPPVLAPLIHEPSLMQHQQPATIRTNTPPLVKKRQQSNLPSFQRAQLPYDPSHVYEVAQRVVVGNEFDKICHSVNEFEALEQETWFGRLYCDLSGGRPFSHYASSSTGIPQQGIERLLQIVFTRYANKEYREGIFVIRGEFGADWFTPILQHPMCILRQNARLGHDQSGQASFDSYVAFYMGPNIANFCQQFRNVGYVPGFNCWSYSPSPIHHVQHVPMVSHHHHHRSNIISRPTPMSSGSGLGMGHDDQLDFLMEQPSMSHQPSASSVSASAPGAASRPQQPTNDLSAAAVLVGLTNVI